MIVRKCKLCNNVKKLQNSHIIPSTVFKTIFRNNNGKGITFSENDEDYVHYSSESWSEYLLCADCERHLNEKYEHYSISALRNSLKSVKVSEHRYGISFQGIDLHRFNLFFTSIIWRAAISNHESYSQVILPERFNNEVRRCLLENKKNRSWLISIKISRLIDKNTGGYTMSALKEFIVSPFIRDQSRGFSFCFLVEGFFIEVFVPTLKLRHRKSQGTIHINKKTLFSPFLHIFHVPELIRVLSKGHKKHYIEGKTKIKRANK